MTGDLQFPERERRGLKRFRFGEVFQAELREIAARRAYIGLPVDDLRTTLTGLSLSGGGIRSAMFNLGVLQALHNNGLLRRVDYLATISGGGYIGGYLTVELSKTARTRRGQADFLSHPSDETGGASERSEVLVRDHFPLGRRVDSRPTPASPGSTCEPPLNPAVREIVSSGDYLLKPLSFARNLIWGIFLNNLLAASFLMAVCSLLALGWRTVDMFAFTEAALELADRGDRWPIVAFAILGVIAFLPALHRLSGWLFKRRPLISRRGATRWAIFWGLLAGFIAGQGGFVAFINDWINGSDFIRAFLPTFATFGAYMAFRMLFERLAERGVAPERQRTMARALLTLRLCAYASIVIGPLTVIANGDTGLGPGMGAMVHRFLPGFAPNEDAWYVIPIYNNQDFGKLLETSTKLFIGVQVVIGLAPLFLPQRFFRGSDPSSKIRFYIHRAMIAAVVYGVPLLVLYSLICEDVSRCARTALAPGQPLELKRGLLCHDSWTGRYDHLIHHDQMRRLLWLVFSLALFLIVNRLADLNGTSMHRFYRTRVKEVYFSARQATNAEESLFSPETRLTELDIAGTGAPYHLILSTINRLHLWKGAVRNIGENHGNEEVSRRDFLISKLFCGENRRDWDWDAARNPSARLGSHSAAAAKASKPVYVRTNEYCGGKLSVLEAMAISGAAISPAQSRSALDSILMNVVNARLGQWLPNPTSDDPCPLGEMRLSRLLKDLFVDDDARSSVFLSDGAHYDNLGLEALLDRGCRLIILSDASEDHDYRFLDLLRLIRKVQAERGIVFENITPNATGSGVVPVWGFLTTVDAQPSERAAEALRVPELKEKICRSHFLMFRFRYPGDDFESWLVALKPSLTGDEDKDQIGLLAFAREQTEFPHHSDLNQFYTDDQCEFYRQLGVHVGMNLFPGGDHSLWLSSTSTVEDIAHRIRAQRR